MKEDMYIEHIKEVHELDSTFFTMSEALGEKVGQSTSCKTSGF